jgi:hypothetical protein
MPPHAHWLLGWVFFRNLHRGGGWGREGAGVLKQHFALQFAILTKVRPR